MKFAQALRIQRGQTAAFVGAGGKTTALFALARELSPCVVTTTTHLGAWQAALADQQVVVDAEAEKQTEADFTAIIESVDWARGVTLVSGPLRDERLGTLSAWQLEQLSAFCRTKGLSLLIEADGARQKPLKAPAAHEPVIPEWVDCVVVVAGLSGLGKRLDEGTVHRANVFAQLAGIAPPA
ncbi:MAG: selenium cofactor biosynthesis protein YqeC, partial [Anaerolineales bacterium]